MVISDLLSSFSSTAPKSRLRILRQSYNILLSSNVKLTLPLGIQSMMKVPVGEVDVNDSDEEEEEDDDETDASTTPPTDADADTPPPPPTSPPKTSKSSICTTIASELQAAIKTSSTSSASPLITSFAVGERLVLYVATVVQLAFSTASSLPSDVDADADVDAGVEANGENEVDNIVDDKTKESLVNSLCKIMVLIAKLITPTHSSESLNDVKTVKKSLVKYIALTSRVSSTLSNINDVSDVFVRVYLSPLINGVTSSYGIASSLSLPLLPLESPEYTVILQASSKKIYSEKIVHVITTLTPLIARLTSNTFTDNITPSLSLKLKSSPEATLPLLLTLALTISPNVLRTAAMLDGINLGEVLVKNLKSVKPEMVRLSGFVLCAFVDAITPSSSSPSSNEDGSTRTRTSEVEAMYKSLITPTVNGLKGIGGAITMPSQREAIVNSLEYTVDSLSKLKNSNTAVAVAVVVVVSVELGDIFSSIAEAVCSNYKKESSDDVKKTTHAVLVKCLPYLPNTTQVYSTSVEALTSQVTLPIPPKMNTSQANILKDQLTALIALNSTSVTKGLVPNLTALLENAVKKHLTSSIIPQFEGLLSLRLLSSYELSLLTTGKVIERHMSSVAIKKVVTDRNSFIYSTSMLETTDSILSNLPVFLANYAKVKTYYAASSEISDVFGSESSPACIAMIKCGVHPTNGLTRKSCLGVIKSDDSVFKANGICVCLSDAMYALVNSEGYSGGKVSSKDAKRMRALIEPVSDAGVGKNKNTNANANTNIMFNEIAVYRTSVVLSSLKGNVTTSDLIMSFTGLKNIKNVNLPNMKLFKRFINTSENPTNHEDLTDGIVKVLKGKCAPALSKAVMSLISCITLIGSDFDEEYDEVDADNKHQAYSRTFIEDSITPRLAVEFDAVVSDIASVSSEVVEVFMFPEGELYTSSSSASSSSSSTNEPKKTAAAAPKSRKGPGDFGAAREEEEWERQIKAELDAKKKLDSPTLAVLRVYTPVEVKVIEEQSRVRETFELLLIRFKNIVSAIVSICDADVGIGNAILSHFTSSFLKLAITPLPNIASSSLPTNMFSDVITAALLSFASCIYELPESHALPLILALITSSNGSDPLPSPCLPAATVVAALHKLCSSTGDGEDNDLICGNSFKFVFPILKSALMGVRGCVGCDDALSVIHSHVKDIDSSPIVLSMRRDLSMCVLTLLQHDRSKSFTSPTPVSVLRAIYTGSKPSTSELTPLLNEHGAMGNKAARIASMTVLATICSCGHAGSLKVNPMVESRVYMNCHASDPSIKAAAVEAYEALHGVSYADAVPARMYAAPLIACLDSEDGEMVKAAADALAWAVGVHGDTCGDTIGRLVECYVGAYPTVFKNGSNGSGGDASAGAGGKKGKKEKEKNPSSSKKALEDQFLDVSLKSKADQGADSSSKIKLRFGICSALSSIGDKSSNVQLAPNEMKTAIQFICAYGLSDPADNVRAAAVDAGRKIVASNGGGEEALAFLLPLFEDVLKNGGSGLGSDSAAAATAPQFDTSKVQRTTWASDSRKSGAVILLGAAALHLLDSDVKITGTVDMLLAALDTPSEDVQSSVAACLAPLMKKGHTADRAETIIEQLMDKCLATDSLAARRGAAYGVSACVKGLGISSLKKYGIVTKLETACTASSSNAKEGGLFVIELLSVRLGLLFEPYVIVLLPALLKCFGDGNDHVRKAAEGCSGLIMSKLSAHGVKLVMPAVLTAFDDSVWRTKQASIRMLGAMTNCAPKQLAACLPRIVPKLTEAFADTHPKVKESASEALHLISTVIRNPEVAGLSAILLKALVDPANFTKKGLDCLLETEFLHAIDAPSLALLIPIIQRGLKDRTGNAKRQSALICGNMCTMINDPKDFSPYLQNLLPGLKSVVLDPIPDVRSTAAKAIGALVRGLGESEMDELLPWLIETLKTEGGSAVERSGAAQGLTEYLIACGGSTVMAVMKDEILPLSKHPKPATREGVLWVLTFMPSSLGQGFAPLIDLSLPALLEGLSDEAEPVREVAMRAGRVLIKAHGRAHVDKILPSLERGLYDKNWRIRTSSLTLLGDLLSMIGGTTVAGVSEIGNEDDTRGAERAQAQIALVLGNEARKRVLARLYTARSDTSSVVRQGAIQVWKTVVSITPRTLREILPILVDQVVEALASGDEDQTTVAGRCLGDIVKKLGDSVLPEVVPILRQAMDGGDEYTRRGVCVGLSEIIEAGSKDQIVKFLPVLVPAVQDALCDGDDGVRGMAAKCFQTLYATVGPRALDEVVPMLLVNLEREDIEDEGAKDRALKGLKEVLKIRSKDVLPYLVPRLLSAGITSQHAAILGSIAEVTGSTIYYHFVPIVNDITMALSEVDEQDEESGRAENLRDCFKSVCRHVEESGVNWLVGELAKKTVSDLPAIRSVAVWMIGAFAEARKDVGDFYEQVPVLLREILNRLNDDEEAVVVANSLALKAVLSSVPAEELVKHLDFCRNLINSLVSEARRRKGGVGDGLFLLPGFNVPKGLDPLLPMYHQGILYGGPEVRETAATGLGELIELTSPTCLAGAIIVKMTGPLIRIVGDRNPSAVKIAIVKTLGLILRKAGPALRAFVPQLQTTFVKNLADPSRMVRLEATKALGSLMALSTRVDSLIADLVQGASGKSFGQTSAAAASGAGEESSRSVVAVQTATVEALAVVLFNGGAKAKDIATIESALAAVKPLVCEEDEGLREGAGKAIQAALSLLDESFSVAYLKSIVGKRETNEEQRTGNAVAVRRTVQSLRKRETFDENDEIYSEARDELVTYLTSNKSTAREATCRAIGVLCLNKSSLKNVEYHVLECMSSKSENAEVNKAMCKGLRLACRYKPGLLTGKGSGGGGVKVLTAGVDLARTGDSFVVVQSNQFLYFGFNVRGEDVEERLNEYCTTVGGDAGRVARDLVKKVVMKLKESELEDDE